MLFNFEYTVVEQTISKQKPRLRVCNASHPASGGKCVNGDWIGNLYTRTKGCYRCKGTGVLDGARKAHNHRYDAVAGTKQQRTDIYNFSNRPDDTWSFS